jgi:hypothetical protein
MTATLNPKNMVARTVDKNWHCYFYLGTELTRLFRSTLEDNKQHTLWVIGCTRYLNEKGHFNDQFT